MPVRKRASTSSLLPKSATGIRGFDEITGGGLPQGRPSLVCGGAGCGKTLFALEFLVRGAVEHGEAGVFIAFEETAGELAKNVHSLGFDLDALARQKKLTIDHIYVERSEIEETGEYDLDGLFIRIDHAVRSIGARRIVLDTVESLFSGLPNPEILRAELRRLFRWLKERRLTAVITAEKGDGTFTRHGLEEYVADCVVLLDHRVTEQVSTRRMRVVKYRGSLHGTNEYPFIIGEQGISVLPITSLGLDYTVSSERISTGVPRLDTMLGGKGYYCGSSILVSGTAGTGKSSVAASFVDAACRRGKKCLYLAFEESENQIVRNMASIGIDLQCWTKKNLLRFHTARPTASGLEVHLVSMFSEISAFSPEAVVIDPITNFVAVGSTSEVKSMMARLIDHLKYRRVTTMFTNLTHAGFSTQEQTSSEVSSLMDTWILLRDIEMNGERNRGLYVLKSRGMRHSNQIREFLITDNGIDLRDVYVGPGGFLMGSARAEKEIQERTSAELRDLDMRRKKQVLEGRRKALDAQIAALKAEIAEIEEEAGTVLSQERQTAEGRKEERQELGRIRGADAASRGGKKGKGERR